MGCTCKKPKIQKVEADSFELPQTGYQFVDPFAEDISRRILSSYFGSPGEYEGLIAQERDIPIEVCPISNQVSFHFTLKNPMISKCDCLFFLFKVLYFNSI